MKYLRKSFSVPTGGAALTDAEWALIFAAKPEPVLWRHAAAPECAQYLLGTGGSCSSGWTGSGPFLPGTELVPWFPPEPEMIRELRDWSDLNGLTFTRIDVSETREKVLFTTADGRIFEMFYEEDCCASCNLEDVQGDLAYVLNVPVQAHEKITEPGRDGAESDTAAWYSLIGPEGHVTFRWYGSSNGYYSERASLYELLPNPKYRSDK